ncbi:hypothetical protein G9A89_023589 [Geosiphon pyriformis]|nr:hypothetical protein G9A89_023589 [Geosiphon pyriformis]
MTDFGLSDKYKVLDGLDQGKVFSPLLWKIFYDLLLCKVARQDHLCSYQINLNFVTKTERIETSGSMTSFFMAGVFVDDTIWVGNGQASIQHILNVVSEFFLINDININNEKTVAIPINKKMGVPVLSINGQAIAVANSGVSHRYLGIFLSTNGLSKPSLAKANSDIRFFSNMVLWKAVSDKQFSYLVLAVLQPIVLCWTPLNPLQYPVKLKVNTSNNFLVDVVCIFLDNKLSLDNRLFCVFCFPGCFPMSLVLGDLLYFNVVCSLKIAGVAYGNQLLNKNGSVVSWRTFCRWKKLGSRGPVPLWFLKASTYLNSCLHAPLPVSLVSVCASVLDLTSFADICEEIHGLWADEIDVYTDSSLKGLSTFQVACGAAAYFPSLNKGLGVEVHGVLSLTLAELQAVALTLECISASVSVALHTDSQAAIDACVAELGLLQLDCRNNLTVYWIKVKVSGNACHFVHDIFCSICKFQWEVGPGQGVLSCLFGLVVNWNNTALVWYPDSHMLSGNMLYNKDYLGVSCLFCGDMELSNHGFTCVKNASVWSDILGDFGGLWKTLMGPNLLLPSFVLQDLSLGVSDVGLYSVFCKGFVLKSWMDEAIVSLNDKKKVAFVVVDFVCHLAKSHRMNLWLFRTKFRSDIERSGLIGDDIVVTSALGTGALLLLADMVHLTGVLDSLDVGFSFKNRFLFLSDAIYRVSVSISV